MAVIGSNERGGPARRLIVVGASNVARSISTAVAAGQLVWQGPVEALIAGGHGRSYGRATSVLGRALPGIGQSGLWKAIESRASYGTSAVLTDVGNDLLYGSEPEVVAEWVDACIARLTAAADTTLVCGMPLVNLTSLSPRRFLAYRALFFPRCRLSLPEIAARATELQAWLRAARRGSNPRPLGMAAIQFIGAPRSARSSGRKFFSAATTKCLCACDAMRCAGSICVRSCPMSVACGA